MIRYLFLLLLAMPALADESADARAKALFTEIRCVTCAAQSIADSEAPLAADLRRHIRDELGAGKDEATIKADLRAHYGDQILMAPPLRADTWLLWLAPLLLLIGGAAIARKLVQR